MKRVYLPLLLVLFLVVAVLTGCEARPSSKYPNEPVSSRRPQLVVIGKEFLPARDGIRTVRRAAPGFAFGYHMYTETVRFSPSWYVYATPKSAQDSSVSEACDSAYLVSQDFYDAVELGSFVYLVDADMISLEPLNLRHVGGR